MHHRRESLTPAASTRHHPPLIIALHWLICVAIVSGVALVLVREASGGREARRWLLDQHRALGFSVLALVAWFLLARLRQRGRVVRHDLPWPMALAAQACHLVMYVLLPVTPLLGWALTSARGQALSFFGLVHPPTLFAPDPELADTLADWHAFSAWSLVALIIVHVSAALWHQWVRRDAVLHAMLPIVSPRPAAPGRCLGGATVPAQRLG